MANRTINTILNLRDRFSGRMRNVANQTRQSSRQMSLLSNNVRQFRQRAVSGFTDVAKKAAFVGVALTGLSTAALSIGNSVEFVNEYRSSLINMQAATGATSEQMASMKKEIMDLYRMNLGESWSDLAQSMTIAKQVTGQMGEQLKQTTKMAVTYRDTFGEEIPETIKASDTMMRNFGITSTQAYNLLAQGAQQGLNKSGELLDTANEYSVYFKSLGFSASEMFDVFKAGLEGGAFNLDKVGDSIKELGIRTKDGSQSTVEAYKIIGVNASKTMKSFAKGGPSAQKAFRQVVNALEKVKDPVARNTASVNLFGTQFEDLEKNTISALTHARSQFDMTKNTMDQIGKIKYGNMNQAVQGIGRMFETSVLIPIADRVLPKLNEFGQWFRSKTPEIESLIDKAFTKGAKVIEGFKDSIQWARDNAEWLTPVVIGLTSAIAAQRIVGVVSKMYSTWTNATRGLTVAQVALNLVTKASPFGWIATVIGLVVAAGVYLYKNWDTVKLKAQQLWVTLTSVWTNIKTSITSAVTGVSTWLNSFPLGQTFLETTRGLIASVKQIFNGFIQFFKSVFKGDWEGAWQGIVEVFRGQFSMITTYAKAPINGIIDMINGVIERVNKISVDIPSFMGGGHFGVSIPTIPKFALGTSYFRGGLAQINERGGELVNLPNGSQVIPADKTDRMLNKQFGPIEVTVIVQGNVIGNDEFLNHMGSALVNKLKLALSNQ
ncbi:phage tail tape measure protein [Paenibacillus chibensis]|uniref:phage tail tape measure protein n=1 Tax=Paenibacillus chibensis TaxID=59846 RepID=UPI000FDB19E1|nr:phage tail tape measure protein [Paenibacillus chibensis]MEC0370888.1 phage tail tape measure protein [Paenibacillus chibensis]